MPTNQHVCSLRTKVESHKSFERLLVVVSLFYDHELKFWFYFSPFLHLVQHLKCTSSSLALPSFPLLIPYQKGYPLRVISFVICIPAICLHFHFHFHFRLFSLSICLISRVNWFRQHFFYPSAHPFPTFASLSNLLFYRFYSFFIFTFRISWFISSFRNSPLWAMSSGKLWSLREIKIWKRWIEVWQLLTALALTGKFVRLTTVRFLQLHPSTRHLTLHSGKIIPFS